MEQNQASKYFGDKMEENFYTLPLSGYNYYLDNSYCYPCFLHARLQTRIVSHSVIKINTKKIG